ncbi:Eukaryotic translation initiation factor 3 subunit L [Balamuthia mandrillaris]
MLGEEPALVEKGEEGVGLGAEVEEVEEVLEGVEATTLPNFRLQGSNAAVFEEEDEDGYYEEDYRDHKVAVIPETVKHFLQYFYKQIKAKNTDEIVSIYDSTFSKLSERFYKNSLWPVDSQIAPLVDNDKSFLILYKELYFRHIYSKREVPTLQQRFASWQNYSELFDFLLDPETQNQIDLPLQWLWNIIDEFIYQFQTFCQNRSKLSNKSPEEIQMLKDNPQVWNINAVLNYLERFVQVSNIHQILKQEAEEEGSSSSHNNRKYTLLEALGYFSLIGLLRVHCLLGDYHLALQTLQPIDMSKKGLFARVAACQITLYYYVGFAYMMLRRYVDAARLFTNILIYIGRTKQYHTRSYQYEQILKKNKEIYNLLAIVVSLSPQKIGDDNIHSQLREKCGEHMARIQRGDNSAYAQLFGTACPKFISVAPPDYDDSHDHHQDARNLQTSVFMEEVQQQSLIPTVRSYLKLYSTIPVSKLASFVDKDEATFRAFLLRTKHKTHNLVWSSGEPLRGEWTLGTDVMFHMDQDDMVHIADTKIARRFGDYFIRHINKFEHIINQVQRGPSSSGYRGGYRG